ncbi:thiaminase II [Sinirhodobacter populi]|nr:thiaminase II [Sinirhodobacter populi]
MTMTEIDFSAGLFGKLRAGAGQIWESYVDHEFVRVLGTGELPEACFRRFLVQDYLFLKHFARAYGLAVYKSQTVSDIRAANAALQGILQEVPLHVTYCARWGLSEAQMQYEPEANATITYTRYVNDIGNSGDLLDLLVALMPCVAGYAEIGQRLLAAPTTRIEGNPYGSWIENYKGEEYHEMVAASLCKFEDIGQRYGGETRLARLQEIFTTASRLEADFWQMGMDADPRRKTGA